MRGCVKSALRPYYRPDITTVTAPPPIATRDEYKRLAQRLVDKVVGAEWPGAAASAEDKGRYRRSTHGEAAKDFVRRYMAERVAAKAAAAAAAAGARGGGGSAATGAGAAGALLPSLARA